MAMAAAKRRNAPVAHSESEAWKQVYALIESVKLRANLTAAQGDKLLEAQYIARRMGAQARAGLHANSPLTVFSVVNPPKGATLLSDRLYTIEYQHKANRKNYYHDFRKGTLMHALPDGSIRISRPGATMWKDLPGE